MIRGLELEEVGDRTMVTLSRSYHGGLTPGVMADQRKALADTTELTETVYFVHPPGIYVLLIYLILPDARCKCMKYKYI